MAIFELKGTRLVPASLGVIAGTPERRAAMEAAGLQLVDILRRPLLTVVRDRVAGGDSLVALDATGQVVTIEILDALDADRLLTAMSRASTNVAGGWGRLATRYPGGADALRSDLEAMRGSTPSQVASPRLILLAARVPEDLRASLLVLTGSAVEIHELSVRKGEDGRTFVAVEPLAPQAPASSDGAGSSAGRRTRGPEPLHVAPAVPAPSSLPAPFSDSLSAPAPSSLPTRASSLPAPPSPLSAPQVPAPRREPVAPRETSPFREPTPYREPTPRPYSSGRSAPQTGLDAITVNTSPFGDSGRTESLLPHAHSPMPPDLGHRSPSATLGAAPTIPAGEESEAALAFLAAKIRTPATLVWHRRRRGIHHRATLRGDGTIVLANGTVHRDPSAAANAAQHTQDVDGWRVWQLGEDGPSLADILESL